MSYTRNDSERDKTYWISIGLSVFSLIASITSLLYDDAMLFEVFLTASFGFAFYALWKRDKVKNWTYHRIREERKQEAKRLLSRRSRDKFTRNKKIGTILGAVSLVLAVVFFAFEAFLLFGFFLILSAAGVFLVIRYGLYLDDPQTFFREENLRNRPPDPHRYQGNAHKYILGITIVSLIVFVVLEYTLPFDSMIEYWISGLIGVIGVMGIFFTMAAWPRKHSI